jgi:hypothetical protein
MARSAARTFIESAGLRLEEAPDRKFRATDLPFNKVPRAVKSSNLIHMTLSPGIIAPRFFVPALLALLSAACASYAAHQHASNLALAQQDDAACQAQGWHYPEPRYVSCRMDLQDARLHKDWMNLQLMHQTQNQPAAIPPPYPYQEVYRPLDRHHFSCRMTHEAGQDYVLCDEDDDAASTRD